MATPIWIVFGCQGEYADLDTWIVCAYATKAQADEHATLARAHADTIEKWRCHACGGENWRHRDASELPDTYIGCRVPHMTNPLDPGREFVTPGADYYVEETTLRPIT